MKKCKLYILKLSFRNKNSSSINGCTAHIEIDLTMSDSSSSPSPPPSVQVTGSTLKTATEERPSRQPRIAQQDVSDHNDVYSFYASVDEYTPTFKPKTASSSLSISSSSFYTTTTRPLANLANSKDQRFEQSKNHSRRNIDSQSPKKEKSNEPMVPSYSLPK